MEALSCEFRTGCPWELLHADDLIMAAESLDKLKMRLKNWKGWKRWEKCWEDKGHVL